MDRFHVHASWDCQSCGIAGCRLSFVVALQDDDYLEDDEMYEDFPFQRLMGKVGEDITGPIASESLPARADPAPCSH